MRNVRCVVAIAVGITLGAAGSVEAQTGGGAMVLTPQDYAEIQQLALRLNQGADFHNSELWVAQWTPDGVWTRTDGYEYVGHEGLREYRRTRKAQLNGRSDTRHWTNGVVLTPTAVGATGLSYYMMLDVSTEPPTPVASGHYEDVFIKTPDGWRISHRVIRAYPLPEKKTNQ